MSEYKVIDAKPRGLLGMYLMFQREMLSSFSSRGFLYLVDGGSVFLRNVSILLPHYMLSYFKKSTSCLEFFDYCKYY